MNKDSNQQISKLLVLLLMVNEALSLLYVYENIIDCVTQPVEALLSVHSFGFAGRILPIFMARPMLPLTFSLPLKKACDESARTKDELIEWR